MSLQNILNKLLDEVTPYNIVVNSILARYYYGIDILPNGYTNSQVPAAGQSVPNATNTLVNFSVLNDADINLTTNNDGSYTCLVDGYYSISYNVAFPINVTGQRYSFLVINSVRYASDVVPSQTGVALLSNCLTIYLTANQVFGLYVSQNSGGALVLQGTNVGDSNVSNIVITRISTDNIEP